MNLELVVLVPDGHIETTLRTLLGNPSKLAIRPLKTAPEFARHPGKDPGCLSSPEGPLEPYVRLAARALVVFDKDWDRPPVDDPVELAEMVESRLRPKWGDRARCVVIDPEVEQWVWSDSPHVGNVLGWEPGTANLRAWLRERGFWADGSGKPARPKEALQAALKHLGRRPSAGLFGELAGKVSYKRCTDPSFVRLCDLLRRWFPPGP